MASDNDLEAQKSATEYAFRRRVHEMTQAKTELLWQQNQTAAEIQVGWRACSHWGEIPGFLLNADTLNESTDYE